MPAGFLFSMNAGSDSSDVINIIADCVHKGVYATLVNARWNTAVAGTLGDFIAMKPGDNVYFFGKRTIYGIGEIVDVFDTGDAAFEVHARSTSPSYQPGPSNKLGTGITNGGKIKRWAVVFKPSPYFFFDGIDMDDLLRSDPNAFKSLRTFQNRSFIQFDDRENLAFKAAILRKNQGILHNPQLASANTFPCDYLTTMQNLKTLNKNDPNGPRPIGITGIVREEQTGISVKKEMTVEVALLHALQHEDANALSVFGSWDYLAHQVTSSPFKPVIYMDKIDIFGYRWIPGYEGQVISKYLVIEIKKDGAKIDDRLPSKDYEQLMKYVDWVCEQYAHGDYTMIEAYLVANSFDFSHASLMKQATSRSFVTGHNAKTNTWNDLTCVEFRVNPNGTISFTKM